MRYFSVFLAAMFIGSAAFAQPCTEFTVIVNHASPGCPEVGSWLPGTLAMGVDGTLCYTDAGGSPGDWTDLTTPPLATGSGGEPAAIPQLATTTPMPLTNTVLELPEFERGGMLEVFSVVEIVSNEPGGYVSFIAVINGHTISRVNDFVPPGLYSLRAQYVVDRVGSTGRLTGWDDTMGFHRFVSLDTSAPLSLWVNVHSEAEKPPANTLTRLRSLTFRYTPPN